MIEFSGTPTEIGRTWGTTNRGAIRRAYERYMAEAHKKNISENTLLERAARFIDILNTIAPHWIEEATATAEIAGLDKDLHISMLANAPRGMGFHECTSYAVSKEFTHDNAVFFHKNRDNRDCEQSGYVLRSSLEGVNKFIAVTDAFEISCSMMVNEKGLAGAADMGAGGPAIRVPKFRGMMNGLCLRYIAERASTCDEALATIRDFVAKGYYAGGTIATRWSFVDANGNILEVCHNNTDEPEVRYHKEKVYFSWRKDSRAARTLIDARPPIDFHTFHNVSRDPSMCVASSISGMTVEISREHPDVLTCAWLSFPAKSLSFPLFMGGRKTPRCLVNGDLYTLGKTLDTGRSLWEPTERYTYANKELLANRAAFLLKCHKTTEAVELLDTWAEKSTTAQSAILNALVLGT